MISIDLTGNCGDQMLRYAICRSVAASQLYDFGINRVTSNDYYGGREQMYFFKDLNYGLPNNTPYGELPPGTRNVWTEKRTCYPTHNYHPFQKDIFDVEDNTHLVFYSGQDARYLSKDRVSQWFTIDDKFARESEMLLKINKIKLDENTCVINCRGGEFKSSPTLFLTKDYWNNAIWNMQRRNPNMKFIVVTEDPEFYKTYFDFPVYHFNIHTDYYIINNAKNLIISNSGFAIFPTWLNPYNPFVIAPLHWAIHNISVGQWANTDMRTWGFTFMDKEGHLIDC